ncbi:MAG: iron ABC transporter permease, partial [Rhizobium pusense]|nr:iron ABC transporter permease [Agrobacterium pusense]
MTRSKACGNSQPRWLFPFVVSVVFALSALPLGRLAYTGVVSSLNGDIWRLLADPALWDAALNTLSTSFLGMLISLGIGGAFALALTLCD